jgi:TetR/AcrR family transcriptional regulator of autoinduction and epiphytic fitness
MTIVTKEPSLRHRKKAATREIILRAAIDEFSAHGFEQPTIERIAAKAGVGKGTVYNYFATKEDILVAFMAEQEARVNARVGEFAERDEPLARILSRLLRHQFRLKEPHLAFTRVLLAQLIQRGPDLQEYIARMQESIDPALTLLFTRLQDRRLVQPDVGVGALVERFKALHFGLSCLWAMEGPPFRVAYRAVDDQTEMFARAIERRAR